jgi:hypothetical protein
MSIKLKIKSKHLSEEARIIRFEERKLLKSIRYRRNKFKEAGHNVEYDNSMNNDYNTYASISHHRKWDVRNEQRATFLARAYIEGIPYNKIEQKRKDEYKFKTHIIPRICSMILRYGKYENGDWVWDRAKNRHVPTRQLIDKIVEWSNI